MIAAMDIGCSSDKSARPADAPLPPHDSAMADAAVAPVDPVKGSAEAMIDEGRQTFRFDTFGDEDFWGGTLKLHEAVRTLTPRQALGLGLKVDAAVLPPNVSNRNVCRP